MIPVRLMACFLPLRKEDCRAGGGLCVVRLGPFSFSLVAIATTTLIALVGSPPLHSTFADKSKTAAPEIEVIDGDSLEISGKAVQLAGIDAPELGQVCDESGHLTACGRGAAFALRKMIDVAAEPPTCDAIAGTDTVTCRIGSLDVAETLLARGAAVALPGAPYPYKDAEQRARKVPLGIWKGSFVSPRDWRSGGRLDSEIAAESADRTPTDFPRRIAGVQILPRANTHREPCIFKGVVSAKNGRVYFGPLDPDYDAIDVAAAGGRMFCSDDEARMAGWHHGHIASVR